MLMPHPKDWWKNIHQVYRHRTTLKRFYVLFNVNVGEKIIQLIKKNGNEKSTKYLWGIVYQINIKVSLYINFTTVRETRTQISKHFVENNASNITTRRVWRAFIFIVETTHTLSYFKLFTSCCRYIFLCWI